MQRLDETLGAMTGMLDTLLDLNQIEAGVVQAEVAGLPVGPLLDRLRGEFAYHAQAKGLTLRVMPCSATIRTDRRLLEQMTPQPGVQRLEIHRARPGAAGLPSGRRSELADRGLGHRDRHSRPPSCSAVFDEYHQIGNEARERGAAWGWGCPSCSGWARCWATRSGSGRGRAMAPCSPSRLPASRMGAGGGATRPPAQANPARRAWTRAAAAAHSQPAAPP